MVEIVMTGLASLGARLKVLRRRTLAKLAEREDEMLDAGLLALLANIQPRFPGY